MDEKKIIKLNNTVIDNQDNKSEESDINKKSHGFQTNPILQKMLLGNLTNKKHKFSIKDLFK